MEYAVLSFNIEDWSVSMTNQLNTYAKSGWSVICCVSRGDCIYYTLERSLK